MSDGQAQPGCSWRNHLPSERPSLVGSGASLGPWRCPALGRHVKLLETEKSSSVLSFHWKEEHLLRRQLGLLDAMKKREASARLTEQKAFYQRCHAQLQRVELAHARLQGDRDLVQQLTCQSRWSYSSGPSDKSGAAVRGILQGRLGSEGGGLRPCSLEAIQHSPPTRGRQPREGGAQAASREALKAEEPWWDLAVHAQGRREPAAQQKELPEGQGPTPKRDGAVRAGQNHLQDPDADRRPKGQLLLYMIHGDLGAEQPKKERPWPRDNPGARGCADGPHRGVSRE